MAPPPGCAAGERDQKQPSPRQRNTGDTDELRELRQTIVLHTYLKQQLLRREQVSIEGDQFIAVPSYVRDSA